MTIRVSLVAVLISACAAAAGAQTPPEDVPSQARFHLGPLQLRPSIALTNMGIDNNVFNAADTDHPRSDFTTTVTPQTDAWIQVGRAWLTANASEGLVYYREFASERSINSRYRGSLWLPLNRITLMVGAGYLSTRDRPGFEIDARSRHSEAEYRGAIELRAFGKTRIAVATSRTTVGFEPDAVFLGRNLQLELNRTTTETQVSLRHALTPVTDLHLVLSREQDRFQYSPLRDADSTRVAGVLKFHARLGGTATFGYRDFQPLSPDVPSYRGPTASVDMALMPIGATRLGVQLSRDVDYSYDIEQPYYVDSGFGLSVTQGLAGPFDVVGRVGAQQLAYRGRLGVPAVQPDRTDVIHWFGGGIGYRVGRDMRVGINFEKQRRTSDLVLHAYDGLRCGMSVTYGL